MNVKTETINMESPFRAVKSSTTRMEDWVAKGEALSKVRPDTLVGIETLRNALIRERHWWPKVIACRKLGEAQNERAVEILQDGLKDSHPEVQRAAVEALSSMKSSSARNALYRYLDKCEDNFNRAFALTSLFT